MAAAAVSEKVIVGAVKVGDIETLRWWGLQGVRVASAEPLLKAVRYGDADMVRLLVEDLGASINQADAAGWTPVYRAAMYRKIDMLRLCKELGADFDVVNPNGLNALHAASRHGYDDIVCVLVEGGANVAIMTNDGHSALSLAAVNCRILIMQHLLEHGKATIENATADGQSLWDVLSPRFASATWTRKTVVEMTALLRVMVLRGAPPVEVVAHMSREHALVVEEGARLRARVPAYLARRRAMLNEHRPLIAPLHDLVHSYEELTTTEELWATGLGVAP
jgi:hypothetical protein